MQSAFDSGKALRDEGAQAALKNAGETWNSMAVKLALQFFSYVGAKGALFEDVRQHAADQGFPDPPSPNAWGAVCLGMSKRRLIVKTGELRSSKAIKSHARAQPVWKLNK